MACASIIVSQHAFLRATGRAIDLADAVEIIKSGEVIAEYPDDNPYPSRLILGFTISGEPLHIVVGESPGGICTLITVYRPEPALWNVDFKTKRKDQKL